METKTTVIAKKQIRPLINQNLIINRLLQSMSNHSGFDEAYLKDSTKHNASHWRKIAMFILVKKFGFTYETAGKVFGKKAPHCHVVVKEINALMTTEGQKHLALPYVNQLMFDIEL
tara:strand:- start:11295 stop:11642 length:348 start_codon:yes stop_codon:yes gene_type:complete